jgi:hypothetical protein
VAACRGTSSTDEPSTWLSAAEGVASLVPTCEVSHMLLVHRRTLLAAAFGTSGNIIFCAQPQHKALTSCSWLEGCPYCCTSANAPHSSSAPRLTCAPPSTARDAPCARRKCAGQATAAARRTCSSRKPRSALLLVPAVDAVGLVHQQASGSNQIQLRQLTSAGAPRWPDPSYAAGRGSKAGRLHAMNSPKSLSMQRQPCPNC